MYDMKLWFLNPNCKTSHLEGLNTNPITGATGKVIQYAYDNGNAIVFAKTHTGNPWDVKNYDSNYIYDTVTERSGAAADWQNSKNYKLNGWPMCPRYWNGDPTWYYYQASAVWKTFTNCNQDGSGDVGPVQYSLQGPFEMDFGGNVGIQQTILDTYLWAGGKNREQLFLTQTYGWVQWTHATLQANGLYLLDSVSVHNQVVQGVVTPVFGCGIFP